MKRNTNPNVDTSRVARDVRRRYHGMFTSPFQQASSGSSSTSVASAQSSATIEDELQDAGLSPGAIQSWTFNSPNASNISQLTRHSQPISAAPQFPVRQPLQRIPGHLNASESWNQLQAQADEHASEMERLGVNLSTSRDGSAQVTQSSTTSGRSSIASNEASEDGEGAAPSFGGRSKRRRYSIKKKSKKVTKKNKKKTKKRQRNGRKKRASMRKRSKK
tara:strand:+ start:1501 stop:2157 length:657 start_codon:yes stop_codon:yes gene_type:complete